MKKIAVIIDIPNWAFDLGAQLIKKELQDYAIVDIFAIHVEPYNDDLFKLLEDVKDYDHIHFLWRKNLLSFEDEKFKQDLTDHNINYTNYINYFTPKISTAVCDHMFLTPEEVDLYRNVFNKYSNKYYTISKKLYNIYKNLPNYKKPECILMDTFNKNIFTPQNLERFDDTNNKKPLVIGWVGNSAWNKKHFDGFDYKGLHTILNPVLDELITEGYNIKKSFADKQIKFTPNIEMPNYFKNIDVYVTCSYQEGTPRPLLEAMQCGVPAIVTDVGVVPEVLGKLQKEFIIGDRTKENDLDIKSSLKKAIIKLYNNREILKDLSNENIKQAQNLDSTNYKDAYIKFFNL